MPPIKSIKTVYNDLLFRSRLEARWAVFFDTLDIAYSYEPEMIEVNWFGVNNYIPDFYLDDMVGYIEIKGPRPTDREIAKAAALVVREKIGVLILWGSIYDHMKRESNNYGGILVEPKPRSIAGVTVTDGCAFSECQKCGNVAIGRGPIPDGCGPTERWGPGVCYSSDDLVRGRIPDGRTSPELLAAYNRAIRYEFEPSRGRELKNYTYRKPTEKMIRYAASLCERAGEQIDEDEIRCGMDFDQVRALISRLKGEGAEW